MGTRKKGVELIFNLQWQYKLNNGEPSTVIGMHDSALTTTNFLLFKSYLLKNSGVAGNDVKVTYLTDNGQEWVIDSQECFQIAMNAFRLKARLGEVIFLKLDKSSNGKQMTRKQSNDVETQSDVDSIVNNTIEPPEWFVNYMKQFKRDLVEEVTYKVASNLTTNAKEADKEKESIPIVITTSRKHKPDISKRSRKHLVLGEIPIDKELLKSKYERKLETKLDKLDAKTKKIKEKKQAIISKIENDDRRGVGKVPTVFTENEETKAAPVLKNPPTATEEESKGPALGEQKSGPRPFLNASCYDNNSYERLMGGELFIRKWFVTNSGQERWSNNTELRLTWGSSELVPSLKAVAVPPLKPGENTTISICFHVPRKPGTYETYWNFYEGNTRFGSSLSCCVIVEEPLNVINPFESRQKPIKEPSFPMYKLFNEPNDLNRPAEKKESNVTTQTLGYTLFRSGQVDNIVKQPGVDRHIWRSEEPAEDTTENAYRAECVIRKGRTMKSKQFHPAATFPKKKPTKALDIFGLSSDEECIPFVLRKNEREKLPEPYPKKERKREFDYRDPLEMPPFDILAREPLSLQIRPLASSPNFANADHDLLKITQTPSKVIVKPNDPFYGNISTPVGNSICPPCQYCTGPPQLPIVEEFPQQEMKKPNPKVDTPDTVMDLSKRMEDVKITEPANVDSDSDWESVCSYERAKIKQLFSESRENHSSNKYGISEKDLIVDLSMNGKEVKAESDVKDVKEQKEENANVNNNEDNNNNNNGSSDNNNSGESFCEVDSEASSVSSGYDVLQIPICEEKEDGSGYVYITIDGYKLPVPKHILRPDFLANAEEAPGPLNTDDEKSIEPQAATQQEEVVTKQDAAAEKLYSEVCGQKQQESQGQRESPNQGSGERQVTREQVAPPEVPSGSEFPLFGTKRPPPGMKFSGPGTQFPLPGTYVPEKGNGRLFIFPQTQPGYEVFSDGSYHLSEEQSEPSQIYNWTTSPTQYSLDGPVKPLYLRGGPYGPLDQPEPYAPPTPDQPSMFNVSPPPTCSYRPYPYLAASHAPPHRESRVPTYHTFSRIQHPNPHRPAQNHGPFMPKNPYKPKSEESPSAPPEPPKPDENTSGHGMPLMFPENLVTGAVNVASSAINTARSVINMISQPKKETGWTHEDWTTEEGRTRRAQNLLALAEMGFMNKELNITLLDRFEDDLHRVIFELIEYAS